MKCIIFGVGSPNDLAAFEKKYPSLGWKTINEYLSGQGIAHLKEPLKISCHRTLGRVVSYAQELETYSRINENRIVAVLFGGLSFALPGIFSTQTSTIPIIGVPARSNTHGGSLDSTTAVYNLPLGAVVGGAPLHSDNNTSLDKAVLIAEKLLCIESNNVKLAGSKEHFQNCEEILGTDQAYCLFANKRARFKIILSSQSNDKSLLSNDQKCHLALQSRKYNPNNKEEFTSTVSSLQKTSNTLYFSNPKNIALFLSKILALSSDNAKEKLIRHHKLKAVETEKKYGPQLKIAELFKPY